MSNVLTWIKENKILSLSILSYLGLFIFRQDLALTAIAKSGYYFKEMVEILPAVFVLTCLIQTWVPTEVIIQNFGQGAGIKGLIISLGIGSLSAGPIYAAFPLGKMLLEKGASIRNIVVILGTWAVVKVPMLINEVKFMGFKYMIVRWIFTILAIVAMGYVMERVTDRKEIPLAHEKANSFPHINDQICVGCGACARICPEVFQMDGKRVIIKEEDFLVYQKKIMKAVQSCPVKAFEPMILANG